VLPAILLDLAGAIYAGDNAFVCSMGWMRIRLAENEVRHLSKSFEFDWHIEYARGERRLLRK
jgi:hypothetical protein